MTDPLEFLPKPKTLLEHPAAVPNSDLQPEETVTVDLPVDILAALDQQGHRSGQTQTQVILEVLRSALGLDQATFSQLQTGMQMGGQTGVPAPNGSAQAQPDPSVSLMAEVERLKLRLRQLEALIPKVEDLAGKSIAF